MGLCTSVCSGHNASGKGAKWDPRHLPAVCSRGRAPPPRQSQRAGRPCSGQRFREEGAYEARQDACMGWRGKLTAPNMCSTAAKQLHTQPICDPPTCPTAQRPTHPRRLVSAASWQSPAALALLWLPLAALTSMPPGLLVGSRLAALRAVPAATASPRCSVRLQMKRLNSGCEQWARFYRCLASQGVARQGFGALQASPGACPIHSSSCMIG